MGATITFIAEQLAACAWYRCNVPGRALAARGHDVQLADWVSPERLTASDIVVLQRPSKLPMVELVHDLRASGKLVVIDLDDDLWNVHPSNPAYAAWQQPELRKSLNACVHGASLVTVTTPELADLVRPMNRNVKIIPNMLAREDWQPELPEARQDDRLVVGWAGSASHANDLFLLGGVVERLLEQHEHLEMHFAGMRSLPFPEHPRLKVVPPVPIEEYPDLLSTFDIGLAPVVDDRFNRCKSDLKFVEFSMAGVPTVAANVATYQRTMRHGETGFLARNSKDWLKYLTLLVKNAEVRNTMRLAARAFAETRLTDGNVHLWEKAYGLD